MRMTIRLNEKLLRLAKKQAADSGRTMSAVIEDALRESLARQRRGPMGRRVRLTTVKGTGMAPGLDLDGSGFLLDRMEE